MRGWIERIKMIIEEFLRIIERKLKSGVLSPDAEVSIRISFLNSDMEFDQSEFTKSSPVDSPHFIVQQLKGYTSRILRQEFPQLKTRVPTLWTRSYYIESVGHISESTVKKYIEDQKNQ